jgi:hypothetical protein
MKTNAPSLYFGGAFSIDKPNHNIKNNQPIG